MGVCSGEQLLLRLPVETPPVRSRLSESQLLDPLASVPVPIMVIFITDWHFSYLHAQHTVTSALVT